MFCALARALWTLEVLCSIEHVPRSIDEPWNTNEQHVLWIIEQVLGDIEECSAS